MIELRPYQKTIIEDIRAQFRSGVRSVLAVAPTGSGKTVCFAHITHGAIAKGNRVMILAHRIELVDQISAALAAFDVPHGFIAAGYQRKPGAPVQVASVQTLARRLQSTPAPDLLVIDEAHHATARNTIGTILGHYSKAKVLGVTATPLRLSGEGLDECFQSLVVGPSIADLIDIGALCSVKVYAPPGIDATGLKMTRGDYSVRDLMGIADRPTITGDVLDHYRRLAIGLPAVAFCVSVEHARHVAARFTDSGISAAHIDGGMDTDLRRNIIGAFRNGTIKVLTSCDLISEGFDCPGIVAGIFLRPTASLGLYMQQVGRCLRPAPGKQHAIILDHAGNVGRHGLPTATREWSLEGSGCRDSGPADEPAVSIRVCPRCFAAERAGRAACSNCGAPYPVAARKVEQVKGNLEEVTDARRQDRQAQGAARSIHALTELGRMRGYRNPAAWARYVIAGRAAKGR